MDISTIISLIITLFFVYFIVSLVASTVLEIYSTQFNRRAQELNKWIDSTFGTELTTALLNHSLIDSLTRKGRTASYIPNEVFSRALLDVVHSKVNSNHQLTYNNSEIIESIGNDKSKLPEGFKKYILQFAQEKSNSIEDLREGIEMWYENAMTRISGTYKVLSQKKMFYISIITVLMFNIDTAQIINKLASNPEKTVEMADKAIAQLNQIDTDKIEDLSQWKNNLGELSEISKSSLKSYSETGLIVDWKNDPIFTGEKMADKPRLVLMKIIGLLISALAGSLGAPFWYELINKMANIRGAGNKPTVVVQTVKAAPEEKKA